MKIEEVNEKIDRLLHDAEHAQSGAVFAARIRHVVAASGMQSKYQRLYGEAERLFPR